MGELRTELDPRNRLTDASEPAGTMPAGSLPNASPSTTRRWWRMAERYVGLAPVPEEPPVVEVPPEPEVEPVAAVAPDVDAPPVPADDVELRELLPRDSAPLPASARPPSRSVPRVTSRSDMLLPLPPPPPPRFTRIWLCTSTTPEHCSTMSSASRFACRSSTVPARDTKHLPLYPVQRFKLVLLRRCRLGSISTL